MGTMTELRAEAKILGLKLLHAEGIASLSERLNTLKSGNVEISEPSETAVEMPIVHGAEIEKTIERNELIEKAGEITELLSANILKGLKLEFTDDFNNWAMSYGLAKDSGTTHQPIMTIVRCASALLRSRFLPKIIVNGEEMIGG